MSRVGLVFRGVLKDGAFYSLEGMWILNPADLDGMVGTWGRDMDLLERETNMATRLVVSLVKLMKHK